MSKLIEKIWNYEYNPAENHIVCLSKIKEKSNELDKLEQAFLSNLDKSTRQAFDKIICKYYDMLDYLLLDAYTKGALFAGKLLFEIINDE